MTKEDVLKDCLIEGNIVKLPDVQLDRKLYMEVAKAIELIGGKWKGGKVAGFVFQTDPTDLFTEIQNGEKRNLKKEYQFFATPSDLADLLVSKADLHEDHNILEPSAGQGAIVNAINRMIPNKVVDTYELMPLNQTILKKISTVNFIGEDFLLDQSGKKYDRIIANPPFTKNQDILHIREMYNRLEYGGTLVSIASKHWQLSDNKKEKEFRNWLDEIDAYVEEIPAGAFKESGTNISSVIIVIDKKRI